MGGRGAISHETTLRLWVQAGGRCEYEGCNQYLLEDDLTTFPLNLADRAHIVGATDADGSPRGDDQLPLAARGGVENLMLLCRGHHRMIDRLVGEHPVPDLRRMKRKHEDRIRLLTGFDEDAASVVVRMVGGIRGAPVEVPRDVVLAAVLADGRFPRFPLAMAGEDIEIDLRGLPAEGDMEYWASGERIIAAQAARIRDARQSIRHLSVFALARIPLLVALGFHLDDKILTTVYGRRRGGTGDGGWGFDAEARPLDFTARHLGGPTRGDRVAVAVSVTAPIGADVLAADGTSAVYEIAPDGAEHGRDLLAARTSLQRFADAYHNLLGRIEADHSTCATIDLYAAVPAAGAVQLGRGVMRDAQPALRIHDRGDDGRFSVALTLGGGGSASCLRDPARGCTAS